MIKQPKTHAYQSRAVRINQFLLAATVGVLVLLLVFAGFAVYWLFLQETTFEDRVKTPIPILNEKNTVIVGEPILLELTVDIPDPAGEVGQTNRFIQCESGNLITLTTETVSLPPGRATIVDDSATLPPKVLDGDTCIFLYRVEYVQNPLKRGVADFKSEPFTVLTERVLKDDLPDAVEEQLRRVTPDDSG